MSEKQYLASLANVIKVGYRSNAFAPLVWFVGVCGTIMLISLIITSNDIIKYILAASLAALILFSMVMYVVLLIKNPNLLQSENYRLEDRKLDLIASKGGKIKLSSVDITPKQFIEKSKGDNNE